MNQTVTMPKSEYESILNRLSRLENIVGKILKRKVKRIRYGSTEWWEKETKEAIEEVRKGNVVSFNSVEELIADLHS